GWRKERREYDHLRLIRRQVQFHGLSVTRRRGPGGKRIPDLPLLCLSSEGSFAAHRLVAGVCYEVDIGIFRNATVDESKGSGRRGELHIRRGSLAQDFAQG